MNDPRVHPPPLLREEYVERLLQLYRHTPGTPGRWRREDRHLAAQLYDRQIPLELVEAAFTLAALRRLLRDPQAPPLSPIRSLHYFTPLLEELQRDPPDDAYLLYLKDKLRSLTHSPRPLS